MLRRIARILPRMLPHMRPLSRSHRVLAGPLLPAMAMALLAALPVDARDYTRSCAATLLINPSDLLRIQARIRFRGQITVPRYSMVNEAREAAHDYIFRCFSEHWRNRDAPEPPVICTEYMAMYPETAFMPDYPFSRLSDDIAKAACDANPGALGLTVTVELQVRGDTGCVPPRLADLPTPMDARIYASDLRVSCTELPGEGGGFERSDEPIGDGGRFEPSGSDDGAAPPPPPPPPSASYTLLPAIRLPGNDLRLIELPAPNWMLCRQACTDEADCGAWTYRAPNGRSGPICLLKRRAGMRVPDLCCRSGIKH